MAYTDLDPFIYFGAPGSYQFMQALADNFAALAAGDSGAPSVLPNIATNTEYGGVGTSTIAYCTTGAVSAGATVAGSNLRPVSVARSVRTDSGSSGWNETASLPPGAALSGTWRAMAPFTTLASAGNSSDGLVAIEGATLWTRIL